MEEKVNLELEKVIAPQLKRQIKVEEVVVKGKPFVEIVRLIQGEGSQLNCDGDP
jgi:hypothetical protein